MLLDLRGERAPGLREVLLANPEALHNDALEGDLYLLRDQLRTQTGTGTTVGHAVPYARH